jgi:HNH endonuclease
MASFSMPRCIWCKKPNAGNHIEHIIPEAIGCPDDFVLKGGAVCGTCNNNLGHLDQAVVDEFDIPTFMAGVPRKGGRPPKISSRGNVFGTWDQSGPVIHINMGPKPVKTESGHVLAARGKSKRNIRAVLQRSGHVADVSFQTRFGEGFKFVRGIVKIALSSLAFFHGSSEVLAGCFDSIRRFVIEGEGVRKIICLDAGDNQFINQVWSPLRHESGDYYAIHFRLDSVEFLVDLSTDMRLFPIFKEKAYELYGPTGWNWLPL